MTTMMRILLLHLLALSIINLGDADSDGSGVPEEGKLVGESKVEKEHGDGSQSDHDSISSMFSKKPDNQCEGQSCLGDTANQTTEVNVESDDDDDKNGVPQGYVFGPRFQKVHLALPRRESMELGIEEEVIVNNRTMKVKQLSEYPPIFEISNFLSENETELIVDLVEKKGMNSLKPPTSTEVSFPSEIDQLKFDEWDEDFDGMISMAELRESSDVDALMIPLQQLQDIVEAAGIDQDNDGYFTLAELRDGGMVSLQKLFNEREKERSVERRKGVEEAWLWHDEDELLSYENLLEDYHERIKEITGIPNDIIEHSEPLQVQKREPGSFSYCQYDSPNIVKGAKCCVYGGKDCQMCRYASLHIFLNEPEGGGELFFPLADDEGDINAQYVKEKVMERCEPTPNNTCTHSLRIPPSRGTAILWYNHHVASHTGWMGHMDSQSIVGTTPVLGSSPLHTAKMWVDVIGDGVEELRPWRFGTNWLSSNNRRDDVIEVMRNDYFQEGVEYHHMYRKSYKRDRHTDGGIEFTEENRRRERKMRENPIMNAMRESTMRENAMRENAIVPPSDSRKTEKASRREEFQANKEDILKNSQPTEPTPPDGVKNLNIAKESAGFRTPSMGGSSSGSSQSRYMQASLLLMQELSRSELETLARTLYDKLQYQCVPIIVSPLGHENPL